VAAYTLPQTVEEKGKGKQALAVRGGARGDVELRQESRLEKLALSRGRGQRREMEKEEMYQQQQRRLLEGEKLKRHTWLLQHEQREKLIKQQGLAREHAFKQQQMQAQRMRQLHKVKSTRKHTIMHAAGGLRSPLATYAREMTLAGLGLPKGRGS
jgi:hypothetical protein